MMWLGRADRAVGVACGGRSLRRGIRGSEEEPANGNSPTPRGEQQSVVPLSERKGARWDGQREVGAL